MMDDGMRVELTQRPDGTDRFEIKLGREMVYVKSIEDALRLAQWLFDLAAEHGYPSPLQQRVEALELEVWKLKDAAGELIALARIRGDNELPHPADDPKLWTARMQAAWDELEILVAASEKQPHD